MGPGIHPDVRIVAQHEVLALLDHIGLVDSSALYGGSGARVPSAANEPRRHWPAGLVVEARVLQFPEDHALVDQPGERLRRRDHAGVVEHLVPETGVEQVQHGMFRPAHVEVHRHPVALQFPVDGRLLVFRIDITQEVPAGAGPLGHGVGFPPRRPAGGAVDGLQPVPGVGQGALGRAAGLVSVHIRQFHRQVAVAHGPGFVVHEDDREGFPPVPLPGKQPVAKLVVDLALAEVLIFQPVDHLRLGVGYIEAIEKAAVDRGTVAQVSLAFEVRRRLHGTHDRQSVGLGEFPVPLVLGGHCHDGAGAVGGEHVVGHPDGNLLAGRRIDRVAAGEDAGLLLLKIRALELALGGGGRAIVFHLLALLVGGDGIHQRMFGRQHHVGGAEQRVRTRGENTDAARAVGQRKLQFYAFAAADPVALHFLGAVRPVQVVEPLEQRLGVGGDPQYPLAQGPANAVEAAHFGLAVDDLLVGERGTQFRAPPDRLLLLVGQAALEELLEDPLGPPVVAGIGGVDLPAPVVGEAQRLELAAKSRHVALGGGAGMGAGAQRVLLGGQPEGVPADGVQHVEAAHALVAGDDVGCGIALGMAHMKPVAAGVGKHVQHVVLGPGPVDILGHAKRLVAVPIVLPLGFDLFERIGAHGCLQMLIGASVVAGSSTGRRKIPTDDLC